MKKHSQYLQEIRKADFDGDLCFTTDNKILVENTKNSPTIFCVQRQAKKIIPTEKDMVASNKLSFGDSIGATTNVITAQMCKLASFDKGSREYDTLSYRILCGQLFQQESIDKAKGIIAKPMPKYWKKLVRDKEGDSLEQLAENEFQRRIAANKKPYFFIYNYDKLHSEYRKFIKQAHDSYACEFGGEFDDGYSAWKESAVSRPKKEQTFFEYYEKLLPVDESPCLVNKICWLIEKEIADTRQTRTDEAFDYTKLKAPDPLYSKNDYYAARTKLTDEYKKFRHGMKDLLYKLTNEYVHGLDRNAIIQDYINTFVAKMDVVCPNEELRCDVLLDIGYKSNVSKEFIWDVCKQQIIKNLLERHGGRVSYPVKTDGKADFTYHGIRYSMLTTIIEQSEEDFE